MTNTTTTLTLRYLDANRTLVTEEIEVSEERFDELRDAGMRIVEGHGEYSEDEEADMSDDALASLAASHERGSEAYSLACQDGLGPTLIAPPRLRK